MTRTRKNQAGQALVFAVVALGVLLMGFAGLGIDIGYLRYEKRRQQGAADSAAIAAAADIPYGHASALAAASSAATTNGFSDNTGATSTPCGTSNPVGCVTVTVNNPPTSGPHNGKANYVEVLVAQTQPTFFMRVLGIKNETITARAVASSAGGTAGSGCIYTLGNTGTGITLNGNDTISAPSCGIVVDAGMTVNGNDRVTAGSIGVAGTYTAHGNVSVSPAPVSPIVPAADPLAYLTPPPLGSCVANPNFSGNSNHVLNPGNYCNGISISGNGNVTFNPGVYEITGVTGFAPSGNGTFTGNGVMFYNTAGTINLSGNNQINFTAPTVSNSTTGAAAGVLFWQAASDTNSPTFSGNNSSSLQGAFYFPGAQVRMNGNNSTALYSIFVAKSIRMDGNNSITINSNFSTLPGGSPIKVSSLVE